MLALTREAAQAVETIVTQPEVPADAVMRITGGAAQNNGTGPAQELQLSVVENPEPDDVVVQGLPMAVEPTTIQFLDDKVLDAEVVEGGVQFKLYQQPEGGLPEEDAQGPPAN
jgi:Fe-S cluster assembly iron-binding protein IscA